ncbi:aldo/keto reductase [Granulicella sp. S156]|uniref:aldo/keto reductase n=1 Tax=Granulicella sp. S156 TaxID=1747224 RepID=UPI00131E22EE|nr:aldo/keto reductase [Granulicella sp. S156]
MQTLKLADTGRTTTQLGYGCSSLMGALGRRESLALLEAAYEAGIRHFDVAPMYGYGEAEACLGEFRQRHQDSTITTKYGIPPARNRALLSVARRLAGPVIKHVPALKQRLARAASAVASPAEKASFHADQAKASLERSLAALRTERIDLWLLHDAEAEELRDDGLLRFLEDSVAKGTLGAFGIGSDRDKVKILLQERPSYCRVLQYQWSVLDAAVERGGPFRIHHRALTDNFRSLQVSLTASPERCRRWSEEVGVDLANRENLAAVMLKASFIFNPDSVILVSTKNPHHMRENVRVAGDSTLAEPARRLHALVQREALREGMLSTTNLPRMTAQ